MNSTQLNRTFVYPNEPFFLFTLINVTTLLFSCIAIVASITFMSIIISHRSLYTIANLLMVNSTIAILILSSDTFSIGIYVFSRDLKRQQLQITIQMKNLFLCHLRGYLAHISFCALIYSYVIHAFYRLAGTIFYHQRRFHNLKFYIYAISIQWMFAAVQLLPIGLGNNQIFLEEEYLCQIPIENSAAIGYICLTNYLIPLTAILIIYSLIAKAVHQRKVNGRYKYNIHRVRRQMKLVQRILILITISLVLGAPYSTFILLEAFSIRRAPSYSHRVGFMFIAIASASSIITIIYFTRSLHQIIIKFLTIKKKRQRRDELQQLNNRMHLPNTEDILLTPKIEINPTTEDTATEQIEAKREMN